MQLSNIGTSCIPDPRESAFIRSNLFTLPITAMSAITRDSGDFHDLRLLLSSVF
jgi:hypothetical protein